MSNPKQILEQACEDMKGVQGSIFLTLESRKGLNKRRVEEWVTKLRKAANTLERLTKDG
jgi:hypothetical protein